MDRFQIAATPSTAKIAVGIDLDKVNHSFKLADGVLEIEINQALPPGEVKIEVSAEGYRSQQLRFSLDGTPGVHMLEANLERLPVGAPDLPAPINLIRNGNFANGLTDWTLGSGTWSAGQGGGVVLSQAWVYGRTLEATAGQTLRYSVATKGSVGAGLRIWKGNTFVDQPVAVANGDNWRVSSVEVTLPAGVTGVVPVVSGSGEVRWCHAYVLRAAPADPPIPAPQGPPAHGFAYCPQPRESMYLDQLTPEKIAWLNSSPFTTVTFLVRGVSWEILRTTGTMNEAEVARQLALANAVTKDKAVLILESWPAPPANRALWTAMNNRLGSLAKMMYRANTDPANRGRWTTLFKDPEPYQDNLGKSLPGPNYWDYGPWMIFGKTPADREALTAIYYEQAQILAQNFPGLRFVWYHSAAAGDGAAPGSVLANQAGNGFLGLGAMYAGITNAIADGVRLLEVDQGEAYDLQGAAAYAASAAYRSGPVTNGLSGLSAKAKANYKELVSIGVFRMQGHFAAAGKELSASDVANDIANAWPTLSGVADWALYVEDEFCKVDPVILAGIAQFRRARGI